MVKWFDKYLSSTVYLLLKVKATFLDINAKLTKNIIYSIWKGDLVKKSNKLLIMIWYEINDLDWILYYYNIILEIFIIF